MPFRRVSAWVILIILAIAIKIFSFFPDAVEAYYSTGIYPAIAQAQRMLLGWIPFSMGDLLYAAAVIYLVVHLVRFIRRLWRQDTGKAYWFLLIRRVIWIALWVYIIFNVAWGLNYNRRGIAYQLDLQVQPYSQTDLLTVMGQIVSKLNDLDSSARLTRLAIRDKDFLFDGAATAYENLWDQQAAFKYSYPSVKPSLFSYLGNYLGFTGYYNPFSGEAQVNTTVPLFIQPFTTCHEIGHQLGYARENEANFAGYLSARSSPNPAFRYSVYYDLYMYARYYMYRMDSANLHELDHSLHEGIKNDYKEMNEFWKRHQTPIEMIVDHLYGEYLRANQQPKGKLTYNEVIAWLIAYYKKYGKEAI